MSAASHKPVCTQANGGGGALGDFVLSPSLHGPSRVATHICKFVICKRVARNRSKICLRALRRCSQALEFKCRKVSY